MLPLYVSDRKYFSCVVIIYVCTYTVVPTLSVPNQNFTVLYTQRATLECIPSNPALSIQWVFYPNGIGEGIPITPNRDLFFEQKRNFEIPVYTDNIVEAIFPYHNITIISADVSIHNGVYVCSIETQPEDDTFIYRSIAVDVLPG